MYFLVMLKSVQQSEDYFQRDSRKDDVAPAYLQHNIQKLNCHTFRKSWMNSYVQEKVEVLGVEHELADDWLQNRVLSISIACLLLF